MTKQTVRSLRRATLLSFLLAACAEPDFEDERAPSVTSAELSRGGHAQLDAAIALQHEISQALWGCYVVGADLVGEGAANEAKDVLRRCFADDMVFETVMPPAFSALGFTTRDGADGFVDFTNGFYRQMKIVRTQHILSNIVVNRSSPVTATARSGGLAVHVYEDGHTFTATIKFEDDFERQGRAWKMVHRTMTVTSLTEAKAWSP